MRKFTVCGRWDLRWVLESWTVLAGRMGLQTEACEEGRGCGAVSAGSREAGE